MQAVPCLTESALQNPRLRSVAHDVMTFGSTQRGFERPQWSALPPVGCQSCWPLLYSPVHEGPSNSMRLNFVNHHIRESIQPLRAFVACGIGGPAGRNNAPTKAERHPFKLLQRALFFDTEHYGWHNRNRPSGLTFELLANINEVEQYLPDYSISYFFQHDSLTWRSSIGNAHVHLLSRKEQHG